MTDDDPLTQYRASLTTAHMNTPADAILNRGDQLRHRRRVTRWAAAGGSALVATALALTLVVTGNGATQNETQLAAFTVSNAPAGASTVTLHHNSKTRLDPDQLRQALAQRGIVAKVTVDSWCDTATEPSGLHQVVTVGRDSAGDLALTIHPSAIPAGAELSIGYFSTRTVLALIRANAPLTCATVPRQAASNGQGQHAAIVLSNS
jgi:hypothetical protein